jgi:GTPase SAR1 family protein
MIREYKYFTFHCSNLAPSCYSDVVKLIIIGDSSVGKSSFLLRFVNNVFHDKPQPSIGVDFVSRYFKIALLR